MRYIPSTRELNQSVKVVEVPIKGDYFARIDEKRITVRQYKVTVLLPEDFTMSDIKRAAPQAVYEAKEDFKQIRTYHQDGKPTKTSKTMKRRDLYTARELARFDRLRKEYSAEGVKEAGERTVRRRGGVMVGDTTEYGENGLPPVING